MAFLDRILSPFGLMRKSRASNIMAQMSLPGPSVGQIGYAWGDNRSQQVQHFTGWTYVAIDAILQRAAMQRPGVYVVRSEDKPGNKQKWLSKGWRRKAMIDLKPHEELEPVDEGHPLLELLNHPNEDDTSFDFWYETWLFWYLTGSSYWWLPPNGLGLPAEAWVLPSHWVWPVVGGANNSALIESYDIRPVYSSSRLFNIPADEIVHFKRKNPKNKIDGYAPLTAMARWIDTGEMIDISQWHNFQNGMFIGNVALMDEGYKDPSQEDIERIDARMAAKFQGPQRYGKTMYLKGLKDFKPLMQSPREMDFNDSSDRQRDKELAGFRVSKVLAGIATEVNRASFDGALLQFHECVQNPLTYQYGAAITEKVAVRYDKKLRVSWMSQSPDDPAQKLAEQTADVAAAARTPNEIRKERGLDPFKNPDADCPLVPMGSSFYPMNDSSAEMSPDFGAELDQVPPDEQPEDVEGDQGAAKNGHGKQRWRMIEELRNGQVKPDAKNGKR